MYKSFTALGTLLILLNCSKFKATLEIKIRFISWIFKEQNYIKKKPFSALSHQTYNTQTQHIIYIHTYVD